MAVIITIFPNVLSPNPFPIEHVDLLPAIGKSGSGQRHRSDRYYRPGTDSVTIPPGQNNCTLPNLLGNGFDFAIGDPTNSSINYDLSVQVLVTNNVGNLYQVLEGMNETLAPYYRYESGTSMAAADVSGVLALIQDYFTNELALTPSPALMKALLINGTRSVGDYDAGRDQWHQL